MDYLNFDLRLGEWNAPSRRAVAEVLASPAGEGNRLSISLAVEPLAGPGCPYATPQAAREVGLALAKSVFVGEIATLWYASYQAACDHEQGLRLRLHITSPALTFLPWELLYDARRDDFFVFDGRVSIVRYLRLQAAPPALRPAGSLSVLAVGAAPLGTGPVDVSGELAHLRAAMEDLLVSGRIRFHTCERSTLERLQQALLDLGPDVVHFVGHAEYDEELQQGFIILEDAQGRPAPLAATDLARLLQRYGTNLVLLNACETAVGAWAGLAPALVRADIPAVVAMQWPVEDRAAVAFSRAFYRALSLGKTVDECVAEGRVGVNVMSDNPCDWAAPVLFLRSSSGHLWLNGSRSGEAPSAPAPARGPEPGPEGPALQRRPFFRTHGPLVMPEDRYLLIERPELRQVLRIAQQPSITHYIALLSARQTGKTTFLFQVMDRLRPSQACVFVDLALLRAQEAPSSFRLVASQLAGQLGDLLGPRYPLPDPSRVATSVDLVEFLEAVAKGVPLPRIVLLLDEVGALSREVSDVFYNTLRSVFTQGRGGNAILGKYLLIFSGAVDLYDLTFGTTSPLNICEKVYLQDFRLEDVQRLVGLFRYLGAEVSSGAAERVYAYTEGHPYLTMRLCALMEAEGASHVNPQAVERAVEQVLVEDDNLRYIIRELERDAPARRRLEEIVLGGRDVPFSRNDPVLASLEMLGVIRPSQPCRVRNRIYALSLERYLRA